MCYLSTKGQTITCNIKHIISMIQLRGWYCNTTQQHFSTVFIILRLVTCLYLFIYLCKPVFISARRYANLRSLSVPSNHNPMWKVLARERERRTNVLLSWQQINSQKKFSFTAILQCLDELNFWVGHYQIVNRWPSLFTGLLFTVLIICGFIF